MDAAHNPYAAPGAQIPTRIPVSGAPDDAEAIRRAHLGIEASFKAIALLLLGLAGVVMLAILNDLLEGEDFRPGSQNGPEVALILLMALVVVPGALGVLFLKMAPAGRILATLIATPGLLAYPVGTLIAALLLYRMYSKKGFVVFGPAYRAIIAATPQVRPHARIFVWFMAMISILPVLVFLLVEL